MKAVVSVYNFVIVALAVFAGAAIAFAFVLIVVDVGIRATGYRSPAFTSAVVEMILLYFALLAAPYLVRRKGHVVIDAIITRLTGWPRWAMEKFVYSVCVVVAMTFAYVGLDLFIESLHTTAYADRSIDVPYWVGYAPMAPCFLLVALEFARYLVGFDTYYAERKLPVDTA